MRKSEECVVKQYDNWKVVRYDYYFKTKEDCANYQLKKNEKLLETYFLLDEISGFNWRMKIEAILPNEELNMTTWKELNENLNKINWTAIVEDKEFNASLCNEIAHDAIAKKERDLIMTLIRHAAESGCFRTILPKCHSDTIKWLTDLGFKVYYQGQTEVSWED